jgi:hypothetical protein
MPAPPDAPVMMQQIGPVTWDGPAPYTSTSPMQAAPFPFPANVQAGDATVWAAEFNNPKLKPEQSVATAEREKKEAWTERMREEVSLVRSSI